MVFRGHRLCCCPGFDIPCVRALAGLSDGIPLIQQIAISEVTSKKKGNPEAQFAGSQQVFNNPAQRAGPASGYIKKNASAFGSLSYFVP